MNKALYFCITGFIFLANYCFAQVSPPAHDTLRIIEILNGKSLRETSIDSVNTIETIAGNVVLRQGSTKFSCDSAIIDKRLNTIEAFGNVHINDADTLHTYAQYLKYYGDARVAHLKKSVKLTDKKGILYTDDLDYDLAAGIGNYYNGGKVINGTTVLTSKEGVYYADTKDVYFRNNVDLTDPKYKIKADSLLYNTVSQVVTFIGPTHIKSKEANIFTRQGTYDLNKGNAFFGTRSLITDSSRRVYQANKIALDEKAGLAELEGSAVIKDSANGVIVTANHIYLNNRNNSFLATNKPVMIIQKDKDSTYIAADTLFSGFTTMINVQAKPQKTDSIKADTASTKSIVKDSLPLQKLNRPGILLQNKKDTLNRLAGDTLITTTGNDSLQLQTSKAPPVLTSNDSPTMHTGDSLKTGTMRHDSSPVQKVRKPGRAGRSANYTSIAPSGNAPKTDSIKAAQLKDTVGQAGTAGATARVTFDKADSSGNRILERAATADSAKPGFLRVDSVRVDTLKGTRVLKLNKADTSVRYFLAFHHVRIFNDSLQSVCDSLFFSARDSVFRLFYDPVVWNGQSQITGDTIYMYTKNKKPERLYVFENGMIVNKNEKQLYNQIAGKTINAYFNNGLIDYARVKGQKAESIYYIQDKDSAYIGMNKANGDVIDLYFKEKELNKVKFINDVHGTMYPMRQIPEEEKLLKNFNWQDKRRPKNKLELFE